MKHYLILYICTLTVIVALDLLWLGVIAKQFYQQHIGNMLELRAAPAILFYAIYAAGIVVFASASGKSWQHVALLSAMLGFLAYATYDLTNLATLRDWSLQMSIVDMAWGTFVTTFSATISWIITHKLLSVLH